jgi:murein DD-endopeptidase MepM/ murein hydrolase activator NlpD
LFSRLGVKPGSIPSSVDWARLHSVAPLVFAIADADVEIFDFTAGYDPNRILRSPFGIGRYDEDRKGMYQASFFGESASGERRTIHVGLDLGAAAGTPVFSPWSGEIFGGAIRDREGDYGGTLIVRCLLDDTKLPPIFVLFGHLSHASVKRWTKGSPVARGELLGWLGEKGENGGWNSHLHFQFSWLEPLEVDLPGAVAPSARELARQVFPDPMPMLKSALAGWSPGGSR